MKPYKVVFTPEALEQITALYHYIAVDANPVTAQKYTDAIINYCEQFATIPHRGRVRDDIRPGLRITHYKKRTVIAFDIDGKQVSIIGIFYGGQDYETALQSELND